MRPVSGRAARWETAMSDCCGLVSLGWWGGAWWVLLGAGQLRGDENQPWATEELEMLLGYAAVMDRVVGGPQLMFGAHVPSIVTECQSTSVVFSRCSAAKQQKPGAVAAVKQSMKKYVDRLVRSSAASQETCSVTGGALAMRRNKRATNKGLKV